VKIALLGFDTEGRASFDYFSAQGHEVTVCDQNPDVAIPAGAGSRLGENYLDDLDRFDMLVRTAGLPPRLILDKNPGVEPKITTLINEFLRVCPTSNVIGVTGTKGKGTTSSLIARMLEAAGKHVKLGGNIGVPPLTFLPELSEDSWVVLELSSFQLIDLKSSPHIGVCLMVVPEHLNWHQDMDEYVQAKQQLFSHQQPGDVAIYFAENELSRQIAAGGAGDKLPFFTPPGAFIERGAIIIGGQRVCGTDELKLLGEHNWQNACAAVTAAWQVTQDVEAVRSVLTSFSGLEHRLEYIETIHSVEYYDDSFGTTPETATVAIESFDTPKVVILGGSDKGASYDELAKVVKESNVRQAILIGEQAERIRAALDSAGFTAYTKAGGTMTDIVQEAATAAEPGDTVLLSTACASFDMFKDYKDRGDQFKRAVRLLAQAV
jgi:UDP-N-acetylmuramoylalanine--D-glutamate ligase